MTGYLWFVESVDFGTCGHHGPFAFYGLGLVYMKFFLNIPCQRAWCHRRQMSFGWVCEAQLLLFIKYLVSEGRREKGLGWADGAMSGDGRLFVKAN